MHIVSVEIGKCLKEHGFDELTNVRRQHGHGISGTVEGELDYYNRKGDAYIALPTLGEVVMWLYEKYGIWIEVHRWTNQPVDDEVWETCFSADVNGDNMDVAIFKTPTEAYEAAIEYALKKYI